MIQNGDLFYMGTDGRAGHHLVGLTRWVDKYTLEERDMLSKFLDGGFKRINGLIEKSFNNRCDVFGQAYIEGYGTLFGILLSADDDRPGCETLAFIWGERKDRDEMISIVENTPFFKDKFKKVCDKYKIRYPWLPPKIDYSIDDAIKELSTNSEKCKYSEARSKCILICEWLEDYKKLKNG